MVSNRHRTGLSTPYQSDAIFAINAGLNRECAVTPERRFEPADEAELAGLVADAAANRAPLAVEGGGTRSGLGRPTQTAATLSTRGLSGVTLYEPAELVLSARAGTPVADIEALLATRSQRLAFEPMDHRPLLGSTGEPTIGGVVACNISGPRRITAGAARDSLIGIRAVTGKGGTVKSGGRVMKNVTGLDLVKFLAGSFGTLAIFSEVTFKLQPAPEGETTLVISGLDDVRAVQALSAALGSPYGITGAAHLAGDARTLIRLDGFATSVDDRFVKLTRELRGLHIADRVEGDASAALWRSVRDVTALDIQPGDSVWRISVKPSDGPLVVRALAAVLDLRCLYDWGGGLVWLATGAPDAGAAHLREVVSRHGGHATLVRASEDVRNAVDVFDPPDAPVTALTRRLKETFDPAGILNPGRMYRGI
jgi:glycolate oxidase FAD binding subunit